MRDTATKQKFVELRANDKSLRAIAKQLKVSKDTAAAWDKKFATEIATRKNEQLQDLYKEYGMVKEARIRRLGEIIQALDAEIDRKLDDSWANISLKDLLLVRREYQKDLNAEYAPIIATSSTGDTGDCIRANFMAFLLKVQAGEINASEMQRQAAAFVAMAQANKTTQNESLGFGFGGLLNDSN